MIDDLELVAELEVPVSIEKSSIVTVERAAYVAIGLLAVGLRFLQLGLRPLNEAEAIQTLAAFRFTMGTIPSAPAGTVPALFTANVLGFTLMGAGDAIARWLPALAGVILVLLPWGLRRRLGRGGALAASFLLAISPSAVYAARNLDGIIVVAACGLAVIVGLINYADTHRPGYLYLALVSLGLGLVAGPAIYTLLLILFLFGLLLFVGARLLKRQVGWSSLVEAGQAVRSEKGLLARAAAVLAGTFGLLATTLVLHPAGVGYAADLFGEWARSFLPEANGHPFIYPLLLLLRYELLILILGLVEVGRWAMRGRTDLRQDIEPGSAFPHTAFLVFWALAAGVLILVAGHRPPGNVLLVVVPMALLAGQGVERAWRWIGQRNLWSGAGVFALIALGIGIFLYLQVVAFGLSSSTETVSVAGTTLYVGTTYLILTVVALLLFAVLGIVTRILRGPQLLVAGAWLAALVFLSLFGFKAMWSVNFAHSTDARELMIMQTTVPEVRLFVDRLEALSLEKSGDAHTLQFTVDTATGPVVAWYLRDFGQQSTTDGLSAPPETVAAVTLAAQDLPIGETFRGQGFALRTHWLPWGLWGRDLVRWLLFTEGSLPIVDQEVVLWVVSSP
ncbi:MAG: TIGR03663 family protein [Anaerolineae bacterium]